MRVKIAKKKSTKSIVMK